MKRHRLLLADDHAVILRGVQAILAPHYDIVGTAADGQQLVDRAMELDPDLVILDISMPVMNGLDAAVRIRRFVPNARLLVLTMQTNPIYLSRAVEIGAQGYVLKSDSSEDLLDATNRVMRGGTWISPAFGANMLNGSVGFWRDNGLTDRQREVLQLVAEGRGSKEIAQLLKVSIKTIEYHRARTMVRLGTHSMAETIRVGVEQGLIPPFSVAL